LSCCLTVFELSSDRFGRCHRRPVLQLSPLVGPGAVSHLAMQLLQSVGPGVVAVCRSWSRRCLLVVLLWGGLKLCLSELLPPVGAVAVGRSWSCRSFRCRCRSVFEPSPLVGRGSLSVGPIWMSCKFGPRCYRCFANAPPRGRSGPPYPTDDNRAVVDWRVGVVRSEHWVAYTTTWSSDQPQGFLDFFCTSATKSTFVSGLSNRGPQCTRRHLNPCSRSFAGNKSTALNCGLQSCRPLHLPTTAR
jgi:hypothetical protein